MKILAIVALIAWALCSVFAVREHLGLRGSLKYRTTNLLGEWGLLALAVWVVWS